HPHLSRVRSALTSIACLAVVANRGISPPPPTKVQFRRGFRFPEAPSLRLGGGRLSRICHSDDCKHERRPRFGGRVVNINDVRSSALLLDIAPLLASRGNIMLDATRVEDVELW